MRGISPLDICHFEYYQGVNASHKRSGYDHGVSFLMTNYSYAKIIGKTEKSGFCIVFILCHDFGITVALLSPCS
jgi:hypothetical protein